jgi:hypothetical protein
MSTGSGAGLNRVQAVILSCNVNTAVVAAPLTAYGTLNVNDSGLVLCEAQGFTKWTFQLLGGGTGYSITLYGTSDPVALGQWRSSFNPLAPKYALPASSWFILPGPAEQTGTGTIANPITATAPSFQFSGSLLGVRAALTTSATPSGVVSVSVVAVP